MKKSIRCPDHKDKHPSAVLYSRSDGSQWLHCKGCKANRLFKEGDKAVEEEYYDESDYGVDVKQCLTEVELLEILQADKGITAAEIYKLGGFVTDQGYLGFKYSKGREVYRRLTDDDRPRFINIGSKGLIGDEILDAYDEIFLIEGLTGWISFKSHIGENAVSSLGSELSEEQAYMLRGKTVFLLYDRDFAGFKGSKQAEARLKEYGATPIPFELPDGFNLKTNGKDVDVNYLIHKEKDEFKRWIENKIRRYKIFDDTYVDRFKKRTPLLFYNTDIPFIKFTQGLYVLSGLSGVGKTTAGISFIDNFAQQNGKVLYINYDLPEDQIVARLASRYARKLDWSEIEANPYKLTEEKGAENLLKQCLKTVKVMTKLTPSEIKHCSKYYSHIIIDYIQRVPNNHPDQRVGLEHLMDDLSDIAVNDGRTIVGISRYSLNGNPFSGSAAIEYHAQGTMILSKTDNDIISCEVGKNTRGITGVTLYKVDYPHQRLVPTRLSRIADEKFQNLWGEKR